MFRAFQVLRFFALGVVLLGALAGCGLISGEPQVIVVTATPGPTQPPAPTPPPAVTQPPAPATTAAGATQVSQPTAPTSAPSGPLSVTQVVDKMRPSTVLVSVQTSTDFGGTGSGFLYDQTGLVVTNAHVVTGAALIKVYFQGNNHWYSARLIGIAPCDDLAIIQVDGAPVTVASVGSSDALRVGDELVALGYPKAAQLGTDLTVTRGVVSKLHGSVDQYEDVIQTDAAINPGNSGGPLVNMQAQVVGINTATLRGSTGINFAISIDAAKPVLTQLANGKKLNYLGWNLVPNDTDLATQYKLATDKGMVVAGVDSGSPASRAGVKPLDIVFDIEDVELTSNAQVCDILRSHSESSALRISVVRGTQLFTGELNGSQLALQKDLASGKATPKPTQASQPSQPTQPTQPSQPAQSTGYIYPAPTISGNCGSTLKPGDIVIDIAYPPGLKPGEAFDIRARPSWELNQPGWRGVALIRETHYVIPGSGHGYSDYSFLHTNSERGTYFLTVAILRQSDGKQLSPESNQCTFQW